MLRRHLSAMRWLCLAIACGLSPGEATAQPRQIVIDCDPGIDDAMAIVLAMQHVGCDIVGITTMFGNAYVDRESPLPARRRRQRRPSRRARRRTSQVACYLASTKRSSTSRSRPVP